MGRGDDKPVAGGCREPFFHLIRDLFWGAGKHFVLFHRAAAGYLHEVAHGRVLFARELNHAVTEAVPAQLGEFFVAEWFVIGLLREVVVGHLGNQDQRVNWFRRRLDDRFLFHRGGFGLRHANITGGGDMHGSRVPPFGRDGGLERGVGFLSGVEIMMDQKDQIRPLRGEILTAAGLTGLDQHRVTLWGSGDAERAARVEKSALVIKPVHLIRVGETIAFLIKDQRVVFPRVPMTHDDVHEFIGAIVTEVMFQMFFAAEIQRLATVE